MRYLALVAIALLGPGCTITTDEDNIREAVADARAECESLEGNTELFVGSMSIAYCYTVTVEEDGWRVCERVPQSIAQTAVPTGGLYGHDAHKCGNQVKRFCESREEYNRGECLNVSSVEYEERYFRDNAFPGFTSVEDCTSTQWLGTPTIAADTLWCAFYGGAASESGCEWALGVWLASEEACLVPIEAPISHAASNDIGLTQCANDPNLSVQDPSMCGEAFPTTDAVYWCFMKGMEHLEPLVVRDPAMCGSGRVAPVTDPVALCQLDALEHVGSSHISEASPSEIAARNNLVSGCEERYGQQ